MPQEKFSIFFMSRGTRCVETLTLYNDKIIFAEDSTLKNIILKSHQRLIFQLHRRVLFSKILKENLKKLMNLGLSGSEMDQSEHAVHAMLELKLNLA